MNDIAKYIIALIMMILAALIMLSHERARSEDIGKMKATQVVCNQSYQFLNGHVDHLCGSMLHNYGFELVEGKVIKKK